MPSFTKSIVVFKNTATDSEVNDLIERVKAQGGQITNTYNTIFKGFAAILSEADLSQLQSLARTRDGAIDYIESDGVVSTF